MGQVQLNISSNIGQLTQDVNTLNQSTEKLTQTSEEYGKRSKSSMMSTKESAKLLDLGLKKLESDLKLLTREYVTLATVGSKMTKEQKLRWEEVNKSIEKTKNQISTLKQKQSDLGVQGTKTSAIFTKLGGVIAGAFTAGAIINYSKEAFNLAAKVEGIREAFNRLNRPELLDELKKATRGTVSEMDLMKNAVKASNFKIPLEQLATFFEFATKRAAQTGESVDFLVESIILGVGRKSPLILDNLGISAVALKEKFKGVGVEAASIGDVSKAMGELVSEELDKIGDVSLTTQQKMEQMRVSAEELKTKWGELIIKMSEVGVFDVIGQSLDGLTKMLDTISKVGLGNFYEGLINNLWGGSDAMDGLNDQMDRFNDGLRAGAAEIKRRDELSEKGLKELKEQLIAVADENIRFAESTPGNEAVSAYWKAYKQGVEEYVVILPKATEEIEKLTEEEIKAAKALKEMFSKQSFENAKDLQKFINDLTKDFGEIGETLDTEKGIFDIPDPTTEADAWVKTFDSIYQAASDAYAGTTEAQKSALEAQLANLEEYKQYLKPEEYTALYDQIQQKLKELQTFSEKNPLAAALGFDSEEQLNQVKDYIGQIMGYVNDLINQQIEASNRIIDDYNTRIEEQQALVEQEGEDKRAGLANNYEIERDNLAKMQKARDEAIKDRERQIKIQRTMSTIEAGISMVTAAANIIKGFSGIPIVGVALGLAAVGIMIAGFIAAQGKVKDATKMERGGRAHYGMLQGRRHSQGGIPIEAEEGEFFTNRRSTAKYLPLLQAINRDDPEAMKLFFDRKFLDKVPQGFDSGIDYRGNFNEIVKELKRGKVDTIYGDGFIIERSKGYIKRINLN